MITATVAMAFTLVLFVAAINVVIDSYGKGAMRTAVDEAARAGSLQGAPGGPVAACQAKAAEVMGNLLPGPFAASVRITCGIDGGDVVAVATAGLPGLVRLVPTVGVRTVGSATMETNPTP